ncbi:MAG: hypothetical protein FGM54_08150, partial [Chitinophagaceae bacterium]|nr:hypothetical protein [Chitinophagaceae bacterium]
MKKSIVIIGPAHPLRGGLASYNERLARQFLQEGHNCQLYTFSLQYPDFLFPGTTQLSSEPAPTDLHIDVKINAINPLNWLQCGLELKKRRPDIIVVRYWLPFMGPCLGSILRQVRKNNHTRIICIADNIIPHEKRPGDMPFTRYFLKPIDAFITMSEKVLNDLKPLSNKPARFVNHPLYDNFGPREDRQTACHHLNLDPNTQWLLFFGFIRPYKGLLNLIEAMHILKQSGRLQALNAKLLVAGEFYEDSAPYLNAINQSLKQIGDIRYVALDTASQTVASLQQASNLVKELFEKIPDNVQLPLTNWHYIIQAGLSANQQSVMSFRNGDPFLAKYTPNRGALY